MVSLKGLFFAGVILSVSVLELAAGDMKTERKSLRNCFLRGENTFMEWQLTNEGQKVLKDGNFKVELEGQAAVNFRLPEIKPNESHLVKYQVPTWLREGEYKLTAGIGEKTETAVITVNSRPNPYRMPVVMWGIYGNTDENKRKIIKDVGFTHFLGALDAKHLDDCLKDELLVIANFRYSGSLNDASLMRVDRNGKPYAEKKNICGNQEKVQEIYRAKTEGPAEMYKDFKGWDGVLINSEVRDGAQPCFHEEDRKLFSNSAGCDIPSEVKDKYGVFYNKQKDVSPNQLIRDDNPIYRYYKWYWKDGDAWNKLTSIVSNAVHEKGRSDIWTVHDPAVRAYSVYGSGGDVDYVSHWTYAYPSPLRMGLPTDELIAMAKGSENKKQGVMKMTQIICYRERIAPEEKNKKQSQWEIDEEHAKFITIPPDLLKIAFWSKISRPIQGIMYHGWGSLYPGQYRKKNEKYCFTNDRTWKELKKLTEEVIVPLGPFLRQTEDAPTDIAFLESFASEVFTRKAEAASANKAGNRDNAYLILTHAQLQPEIIYEETIQKNGLGKYKALVMVDCEILPESVFGKIKEFQKKGGIIIGDEKLAPAIIPDIMMKSFKTGGQADKDKELLLSASRNLREKFDKCYSRKIDSGNPEIVVRTRQHGQTHYAFVINDHRKFGNYVGQYGKVMEEGVQASGKIIYNGKGFVYDLIKHKKVPELIKGNRTEFDVALQGGEGTLFMISPEAIGAVNMEMPQKIRAGDAVRLKVSVNNEKGKALRAVIPVKVEIKNPAGKVCEGSGYHAAIDGTLLINFVSAPNDTAGKWNVTAEELASGKTAQYSFDMLPAEESSAGKSRELVLNGKFPEMIENLKLSTSATDTASTTSVAATCENIQSKLRELLKNPEGKSALLRELDNQDTSVRRIAFSLLASENMLSPDTLKKALADNSTEVRICAVKEAIKLKNNDTLRNELLNFAIKDKDKEISQMASSELLPFKTEHQSIRETSDHVYKVFNSIILPSTGWKFKTDPENIGHWKELWFKNDFDKNKWTNIETEKFWQKCGWNYEGTAWYSLDFALPAKPADTDAAELHFGAVDESAWVWVNGEFAGVHDIGPAGWEDSFDLDITNLIKWNGMNKIVVRVLNREAAGGIWKPVSINFFKLEK